MQKWFKPNKGDFHIHLPGGASYEPEFVVETRTTKFICEPKAANEMESTDVKTKASATAQWCQYATEHEGKNGGKRWTYLLIPHDAILDNKTLQGLAATYTFRNTPSDQQRFGQTAMIRFPHTSDWQSGIVLLQSEMEQLAAQGRKGAGANANADLKGRPRSQVGMAIFSVWHKVSC